MRAESVSEERQQENEKSTVEALQARKRDCESVEFLKPLPHFPLLHTFFFFPFLFFFFLYFPVWSGSPDRPYFEKAKCRPEEKSPPPESK